MKNAFLLLFSFLSIACFSQQVELVKNIFTEQGSTYHDPDPGVKWNDMYFYSGASSASGREPWVTDGTAVGTDLLKDIRISNASSNPSAFSATSLGVFFRATDLATGMELYITDGTPQGTRMVVDLVEGEENGGPSAVFEYNGTLYFTANSDVTNEAAIWTTDGTAEGTQLFLNLDNMGGGSISSVFEHNGILYMNMSTGDTGSEVFKTDGTPEGTALVKDLQPGNQGSSPGEWLVYNNELYFICWNSSDGREMWKTDGTTEGTIMVKDINPGSSSGQPNHVVEWNGLLYFSAQNGSGRNLWSSDGTEEGTVQISFIDDNQPNVSDLTIFNDLIYFAAESDENGKELWLTDGTTDGTSIAFSPDPDDDDEVGSLSVFEGNLYFSAEGPDNGKELWRLNGETLEYEEWDLNPGSADSSPFSFRILNDKLYFAASNGNGNELFTSDGTEEGTFMLMDIDPDGNGYNQFVYETLGDKILFLGNQSFNDIQFYTTDGTSENTQLVKEIVSESWNRIRQMTAFGDYLFFNAEGDGGFGQELWRSDGTPEGTMMYQDVYEGSPGGTFFRLRVVNNKLVFDSGYEGEKRIMVLDDPNGVAVPVLDIWGGNDNVANIEVFNNEAYFSARDTDDFGQGDDLWKTDGTPEGTVKVYNYGTYDISPEKFFSSDSHLWFFGEQYGTSSEWGLYRSDGTSDGTEFVEFHDLDGNNWGAYVLEPYGDGVLYTVFTLSLGRELYYSDGTPEGSYLVQSIGPGSDSPGIVNLVPLNGEMYFIANNGSNGVELWKTDATGVGTNRITDIIEGTGNGALNLLGGNALAELDGSLIFGGANSENDFELFISDGTAEGTNLLAEINPYGSSSPHNFFTANGKVYFTADDGVNGPELWRTDGTTEGTELVDDINPGVEGSFPQDYYVMGDFLYFIAYRQGMDRELFRYDLRCLFAEIEAENTEFCLGDEGTFGVNIASAEGEVNNYTWSFSDDTSYDSESVIKEMNEAGTFEATLVMNTDQGCEGTVSITYLVNETPQVSFFGPDEPQCLTSNYAPDNQTLGTNEDTEWLWNFGDDNSSSDQYPSHTYTEVGTYTVSLTASNGICSNSLEVQQEVYAPEFAVETITPSTCFGEDDASIVVSGTSILGEVTYSINGVDYQSLGEFLSLEAGELEVFFRDDYGCEVSTIVDVPEPDELAIDDVSIVDAGLVTITFDVSGGTPPYLFNLVEENMTNDTGVFEGAFDGTLTIVITDGNGCQLEDQVIVVSVASNTLNDVQLYPNPTSDILYFKNSLASGTVVDIFNGAGQWVKSFRIQSNLTQIDVSDLPSGLYSMQIDPTQAIRFSIVK